MIFLKKVGSFFVSLSDLIRYVLESIARAWRLLCLKEVNQELKTFDGTLKFRSVKIPVGLEGEFEETEDVPITPREWWERFWELQQKRQKLIGLLYMHEPQALLL